MIASKTLKLIDDTMRADQGAAFRAHLRQTMPTAEDAYRSDDGRRSHLGASRIGNACSRELFYSFRWALLEGGAQPRMLRLWNRGHLEEPRMVALMLMCGIAVYQHDESGKQFRISDHGGHFGGSLDCVLVGVPDLAAGVACLGEFKTYGDKYFNELRRKGVQENDLKYYVQMNVYMHKRELTSALFLATNKNTDDLHGEIVAYNENVAITYLNRAAGIIGATAPLPRLSENPTWHECKWCTFSKVCHHNAVPDRNCRTCSAAQLCDGGWFCGKHGHMLDKAAQIVGCDDYARAF